MSIKAKHWAATALAAVMAVGPGTSMASSHREAPGITTMPKVDGTDFYMFRSYEAGRDQYVTLIANYQPDQSPGNGPNYYTMDPDAIYEIHVDNNGDAREDLTFQFKFANVLRGGTGVQFNINGVIQPNPLRQTAQVADVNDPDQGETEQYTMTVIRGDRRAGVRTQATRVEDGNPNFRKPFDNAGNKTTPQYDAYSRQFIYNVNIPGCNVPGKMFVGQRADAFAVNLGPIFDLVNFVPIEGDSAPGAADGRGFPGGITQNDANQQIKGRRNVSTLALEVPIPCLTSSGTITSGGATQNIGAWTTASLPQARMLDPGGSYNNGGTSATQGGAFVQVSRLGMPLVNEVVIGLPQKNLFNAAVPTQDTALASYVTNPTFPAILDALFRVPVNATLGTSFTTLAPTNFPRNDLVATFLTGLAPLNQLSTVTPSEMLRLNTTIAPVPAAQQSPFGVAGDDLAGFPNGRRPGDDVVDIVLRVAMGRLCHPVPIQGKLTPLGLCNPADAPTGMVAYTDGAPQGATALISSTFPYLTAPLRGAPRPQDRP